MPIPPHVEQRVSDATEQAMDVAPAGFPPAAAELRAAIVEYRAAAAESPPDPIIGLRRVHRRLIQGGEPHAYPHNPPTCEACALLADVEAALYELEP